MHNQARRRPTIFALPPRAVRSHLSATHIVRSAASADVAEIHDLVALNAARGLLLPRTHEEIALSLDDYLVVADDNERILACAALQEYSPSLAEVASVVVSDGAQGRGLGSVVVLGIEAMARRRGIEELFAVSLADRFFESLGYERTSITRYPEKLSRYDTLARRGVDIEPKPCFRKRCDCSGTIPL